MDSPLGSALRPLLRIARSALVFIAVLLTLAAFARVGWRTMHRDQERPNEKTLTVMHWSGDGGQEEDRIVEDALREFELAHPGVRVERINPGDAGSFYTKLQTMMAAGAPPDVFYVGYERLANFASLDLLLPLDSYVAQEAQSGKSDALDLDAFYPQTVEAFRFDGARVGSGTLYGIPKDFTTVGFYYNKDLFRKAGIAFPTSDWTWDEYIKDARALGALPGITGSEFVTWPVMVRTYLRTEGAEAIDGDLLAIRVEEPAARVALEQLRAWRHDEAHTLTSGKSKIATGASVFLGGKVGMAGPFGRWVVPSYRNIPSSEQGGFAWDFAPLPRGKDAANCVLTVSWSIAKNTRHAEESWELVKWLTNAKSQAANARLGLAIPTLKSVAQSPAFLESTLSPANNQGYLDAIASAQVVAWPADPTFEQLLGSTMDQGLKSGDLTIAQAILEFRAKWDAHVQFVPGGTQPMPMPWNIVSWIGFSLLALLLGWILYPWIRPPHALSVRSEERAGFLFASPWVLGALLFMAFPIFYSLILSMTDWQGVGPLSSAHWVGSDNYTQLIARDGRFHTSIRVTLFYAAIAVPIGQLLSLLAAILLAQKVRGIALFRAAWYLPSVLAGVGVAILWRWVFDSEGGLANRLLEMIGIAGPEWFGKDAAIAAPPAFALMSFWLIGGSMMVYLAGLQQIPKDLYEAAEIDGASAWRKFWRITLPMLSPVILFNLIMAIIGSFQVFTQAFVMTGGEPGDLTRFYVLYLFNHAFELYDMGYASAMAWILLLVVLVLTAIILRMSSRAVYYEAMKK
ncbi:MAG: extracellular solute-binding protein [Phycisphaerales bacterium]|nr:extracellular solute-binding protein [Phycisphaerales bacterium]